MRLIIVLLIILAVGVKVFLVGYAKSLHPATAIMMILGGGIVAQLAVICLSHTLNIFAAQTRRLPMPNSTAEVKLLRDIADEMQGKPWRNDSLGIEESGCICPLMSDAISGDFFGKTDILRRTLGVQIISHWNDSFDTRDEVIAALRKRADELEAGNV